MRWKEMFYESNRFSHAPGYIFMVFSQFMLRLIPLPRQPLNLPGEAGVFEFEVARTLQNDRRIANRGLRQVEGFGGVCYWRFSAHVIDSIVLRRWGTSYH